MYGMKIYLAAPFFNPEQRHRRDSVLGLCEDLGFVVWSPERDGIIVKSGEDTETLKKAFEMDIVAIDNCEVMVGITSGKDVGTLIEMGYAMAKKKCLVGFADDLGDRPFNLMIAQGCNAVARNLAELQEALEILRTRGVYYKAKFQGSVE